jgi:outer membrane lipoprotein carrier protein
MKTMKSDRRRVLAVAGCLLAALWCLPAAADGLGQLRDFVRDVRSARAEFTQTVTSADGSRKKASSGVFEFSRPNRFRFQYQKPFEQLIVADGVKVWIFDPDLNQASARKLGDALGSTPAALLAGANLDKDFELSALPSQGGLEWVRALPKVKDGSFQSVQVGFRNGQLAAVEVLDQFGQRTLLQFARFEANANLPSATFQFKPPPGADVVEQ